MPVPAVLSWPGSIRCRCGMTLPCRRESSPHPPVWRWCPFWSTLRGTTSVHPSAIGIGLGHRRLDRPNLVRLCLNQGRLTQRIRGRVGSRWWCRRPGSMMFLRKTSPSCGSIASGRCPGCRQSIPADEEGRAGVAVTVLVSTEQAPQLRRIWFEVGPSIGLRERQQGRWLLPRRAGTLATPWGLLEAKQVRGRTAVARSSRRLMRFSGSAAPAVVPSLI
ncbi:MAG: hypothetical protein CM15mP77_3800 [Synechococcus sp.]|nr:MAG: hypothetical protein CM15mP77_3800 [Synechococcus sp.]